MKLRNKLLVALAPAATIATITPIALTSCSNSNGPTTISYTGEKEFAITSSTYNMEFTLDKELPQGWTLSFSLLDPSGTMAAGPKSGGVTTSGTKVTVACEASKVYGSLTPGDYASYGLTITCRNAEIEDVWKVNIEGFKVTYQGA